MSNMEDKVSRAVERPMTMNNDALAEHLAVDTNRLRMVRVEAEIAPCEQITTVTYTLERAADPRIDDHNI